MNQYQVVRGSFTADIEASFYDTNEGKLTFFRKDSDGNPCAFHTYAVGCWDEVLQVAEIVRLFQVETVDEN